MVVLSPSSGARRQLSALAASQPESGSWLALLTATMTGTETPVWDEAAAALSLRPASPTPQPLLAGASIPLADAVAGDWLRRLFALASDAGPDAISLAGAARSDQLDPRAILAAAANQDASQLAAHGAALGVAVDTLSVVAQLAATPLLQACRRRLASAVAADWSAGYCPICGSWPALAERRGLERARRLRCVRCGADWGTVSFRCPYCGTDDHRQLGSLVSESDGEARGVDTCICCRGYIKTVSTLRAWAADEVALADLATIDLDLAALDRDYARPGAPGLNLGLCLVDPSPAG
jgi:FdhE protein